MDTLTEPLSKKQRAELEGIVAPSTQISRAVAFLAIVALFAFLLHWLQIKIGINIPLWFIFSAVFSYWLYRISGKWTGGKELRENIRQDLANGNIVISIVEPLSVTEIQEIEDEGPSYIIYAKTGEVCILSGQEIEKYRYKGFPWSKFGVARAAQSNRFFGLRCLGESISVSDKREAFTLEVEKQLGLHSESFVILNNVQRAIIKAT